MPIQKMTSPSPPDRSSKTKLHAVFHRLVKVNAKDGINNAKAKLNTTTCLTVKKKLYIYCKRVLNSEGKENYSPKSKR